MIYITSRHDILLEQSFINNVWEIEDCEDPKQAYNDYMVNAGADLGLVINPHWQNVMDYQMFHSHLSEEEFRLNSKLYNKFWKNFKIDRFIAQELNGKKLEYKKI